jgi:dethiobiotin synthase
MNHQGVFITGTDTNIGKTLSSALLASALKQEKKRVRYFKPIQTGPDSDTEVVVQLSGLDQNGFSQPIYLFPEPIAPSRAAFRNGVEIEIDRIQKELIYKDAVEKYFWIVEGAGGLLVPINSRQTIRDLVLALDFPLIVVASTRIGTINHTLLTVESARRAGCRVVGIILNGRQDAGLEELISGHTGLPLLGRILPQPVIHQSLIHKLARETFSPASLLSIFSAERIV